MSNKKNLTEEQITEKLNAYLQKYFTGVESLEAVLKQKGSIELSDAYVQYLVDLITMSLKPIGLNPVSNLCTAVMNFVDALQEKTIYTDLENMLEGGDSDSKYMGIPLSTIERAVLLNYSSVSPIKKRWRAGKINRIVYIADVNAALVSRRKQILKYFNQVYLKHNITAKINLLEFSKDSLDGMPLISGTKIMGI